MDVSIIIVNFNTRQMTSECIDSIIEKTQGLEFEIILVDNASTDGSKEFFEKDERITYIYSEKNGGFGYGNNLGMKVAKGKYFFLLNSDTLLINNAVKEFYDYAEKDDKKRVYGSYLVNQEGLYTCSFNDFPAFTIYSYLKRKIKKKETEPNIHNIKKVEVVCGADMFFNRYVYEHTGGFDENIFMYGEDCELQFRLYKDGYSSYLINSPRIIHIGKGSSKKKKKNTIFKPLLWKSHFYVLKKHMSPLTYIIARIYYSIIIFIRYGITNRVPIKILFKVITYNANSTN